MAGNIGFGIARRAEQRSKVGKLQAIADERFRIDPVRRAVGIDKAAQVNSLLAVRRQAHHFPFIAVGDKTEEAGELRVKKSKRIGPIESAYVIETARAAMPNRSGFPRAAAVHDHHSGIVKSRISVSANRVCQMVIDKPKARLVRAKQAAVWRGTGFLMPHAEEVARGIQKVYERKRPLAGRVEF